MAKFFPTSDIDIGISRMAIVEGVTGSFGGQCTLAQMERVPECFAVFIEGEAPQILIAHDNLEYSPDGWRSNDDVYVIDAKIAAAGDVLREAFRKHGLNDIDFNVIHIVDCAYETDAQSFSNWPLAVADPMVIAESIEGEARPDMNAIREDTVELIAADISGTEILHAENSSDSVSVRDFDAVDAVADEVADQFSDDEEIVISTNSSKISLGKIKRTPNVFDDRMVEVLQEIMGRLNLVSASYDDRSYDTNVMLSADGIFPAIVVSAAQSWALLLHSRPNMPGFFVRLKTDPNAILGYRVEAIHSNMSGSVPVAIFQAIKSTIDDSGNCDLMDIIDAFHASLETYRVTAAGNEQDGSQSDEVSA